MTNSTKPALPPLPVFATGCVYACDEVREKLKAYGQACEEHGYQCGMAEARAALQDCVAVLEKFDTIRHLEPNFPALDNAKALLAAHSTEQAAAVQECRRSKIADGNYVCDCVEGCVAPVQQAKPDAPAFELPKRETIRKAIHYPECWDTVAYPTLATALAEIYAFFKCQECAPVQEAQALHPTRPACRTHCCLEHGCKYGYADCPVVAGEVKQAYPCEFCSDEAPEPKPVNCSGDSACCPENEGHGCACGSGLSAFPDIEAFETLAKFQGLQDFTKAEDKAPAGEIPSTSGGKFAPATYYNFITELAYRVWANKPAALASRQPVREPLTDQAIAKLRIIAEENWNENADHANQWDALGGDEKDELFARTIEKAHGIATKEQQT